VEFATIKPYGTTNDVPSALTHPAMLEGAKGEGGRSPLGVCTKQTEIVASDTLCGPRPELTVDWIWIGYIAAVLRVKEKQEAKVIWQRLHQMHRIHCTHGTL